MVTVRTKVYTHPLAGTLRATQVAVPVVAPTSDLNGDTRGVSATACPHESVPSSSPLSLAPARCERYARETVATTSTVSTPAGVAKRPALGKNAPSGQPGSPHAPMESRTRSTRTCHGLVVAAAGDLGCTRTGTREPGQGEGCNECGNH